MDVVARAAQLQLGDFPLQQLQELKSKRASEEKEKEGPEARETEWECCKQRNCILISRRKNPQSN